MEKRSVNNVSALVLVFVTCTCLFYFSREKYKSKIEQARTPNNSSPSPAVSNIFNCLSTVLSSVKMWVHVHLFFVSCLFLAKKNGIKNRTSSNTKIIHSPLPQLLFFVRIQHGTVLKLSSANLSRLVARQHILCPYKIMVWWRKTLRKLPNTYDVEEST